MGCYGAVYEWNIELIGYSVSNEDTGYFFVVMLHIYGNNSVYSESEYDGKTK